MEEIKSFLEKLVADGVVKGKMGGPKGNVLVCETMNDFALASGECVRAGFDSSSPGGFSGASDLTRQATDNKVWKSGTLCAVSYHRRTFLILDRYLLIISKKIVA